MGYARRPAVTRPSEAQHLSEMRPGKQAFAKP